ncbi:MAG: choice-of-anchor R domain-containing protein, partial [Terriglobales bacterium]
MVRVLVSRLALCTAILALAGSSLFAQDARTPLMSVTKGSPNIHPSQAYFPGLVKLYTNLGSKTDTYTDNTGWTISGPDSIIGSSQAIAQPYTPSADATIEGIQVAAQWAGSGTNEGAVAVFSDKNGLPGKPLKVWNVKNLPTFGTCCDLVTVKDPAGLKVNAGTQYWVVVGTDTASETAWDVWDFTWNESTGTVAYEGNDSTGGLWMTFDGTQSAMAIYGT